jgi:nucleotide-binding universal stress UspA family protein
MEMLLAGTLRVSIATLVPFVISALGDIFRDFAWRLTDSRRAMPKSTFLVAYDGRDQPVVDSATRLAKAQGAMLLVVHILEWSPYTFLTQEELAERHKARQAELARADTAVMAPVLARIREAGVSAEGIVRHGSVIDLVNDVARERQAELIFVGRANSLSERVFGSVASGLAQSAPVPVVIVP